MERRHFLKVIAASGALTVTPTGAELTAQPQLGDKPVPPVEPIRIHLKDVDIKPDEPVRIRNTALANGFLHNPEKTLGLLQTKAPTLKVNEISIVESGRIVINNAAF